MPLLLCPFCQLIPVEKGHACAKCGTSIPRDATDGGVDDGFDRHARAVYQPDADANGSWSNAVGVVEGD